MQTPRHEFGKHLINCISYLIPGILSSRPLCIACKGLEIMSCLIYTQVDYLTLNRLPAHVVTTQSVLVQEQYTLIRNEYVLTISGVDGLVWQQDNTDFIHKPTQNWKHMRFFIYRGLQVLHYPNFASTLKFPTFWLSHIFLVFCAVSPPNITYGS